MYVGCGGFLAVFTFSILFESIQAAKQRWRVLNLQVAGQTQKGKSRNETEKRIHSIPFIHSTLKLTLKYVVIGAFFLLASNTTHNTQHTTLLKSGPLGVRQEVADDDY